MIERRIFKKRKINKKKILFILCILFFSIIYIYYFTTNKVNEFIVIPENTEIFFIIPDDRGGQKVPYLDKKSLNLKLQNVMKDDLDKTQDLLFSIQFYSDNEIKKVSNFLRKITDSDETIYSIDDFFILSFKSEIGIEYFLLYKNFTNRHDAENYCLNFLPKIDNCLIIDTTKF